MLLESLGPLLHCCHLSESFEKITETNIATFLMHSKMHSLQAKVCQVYRLHESEKVARPIIQGIGMQIRQVQTMFSDHWLKLSAMAFQ